MPKKIKIICKNLDNREFEFPIGTTLREMYDRLKINLPYPVMMATVNYKTEDLMFQVFRPKIVEFKDTSSEAGYRTYVRSLTMVLAKAVKDLFPNDVLRIEHPISHGYYCNINGRETKVSAEKIAKIKTRMKQIIADDLPIISHETPKNEAIKRFEAQGDFNTVSLIERLGKPFVRYFSLGTLYDYYVSVLVPSTGYLSLFDLREYENGIFLQVIDRHHPDRLSQFEPQPKLFKIFDEFSRWNTLIGIENSGAFNRVSNPESIRIATRKKDSTDSRQDNREQQKDSTHIRSVVVG